MLPHVILYNATVPSKFNPFPKYEYYIAAEKYAQIARSLNLPSNGIEEGVYSLIEAIKKLAAELQIPATLQEAGIEENKFLQVVDRLADQALKTKVLRRTPMPLVSELKDLYLKAYYGA